MRPTRVGLRCRHFSEPGSALDRRRIAGAQKKLAVKLRDGVRFGEDDLEAISQASFRAFGPRDLTLCGKRRNRTTDFGGSASGHLCGLLGADYKVENSRYRFAKVYGGLNWNPELRAPLTEPGVDVKTGEYLLAVEGKDLKYPENPYSRFERTAGRITEITVGPNPDGNGSRTVKVVPIEDESALRNRDWVEKNLRYVTDKTQGRVAYVYVPNTSTLGHQYFTRYFFPQANRQAIIVDERHNGGGQVADYYIDILRRPFISYWAMRYGGDLKTPMASILLPWMFRKLKIGTLVGRRTWGGLVGTLGFPVLMDGGNVTAPNLAIWDPQGGWVVENEGVPPDIDVEQTPADVIAGRDPQLDRAIAEVMKQLEANPQPVPKRPEYPVKTMK